MKICFASRNPGKIAEINTMLPDNIHCLGLSDLKLNEDIEETGDSLKENAFIKARFVYNKNKIPVFADDSGLFCEGLNGEPGIYSARYAGPLKSDEANINKLLDNLAPVTNKTAAFKTGLAYIDSAGEEHYFTGEITGKIIEERRGSNGFGYDPIFIPNGYHHTFAELDAAIKNSISHRYIALKKFVAHVSETTR